MGSTTASSNLAEPSSSQGSPGINNSPLSLQLTNEDEKKRRILEQIDWRSYECKTWHLEPTVRYFVLYFPIFIFLLPLVINELSLNCE